MKNILKSMIIIFMVVVFENTTAVAQELSSYAQCLLAQMQGGHPAYASCKNEHVTCQRQARAGETDATRKEEAEDCRTWFALCNQWVAEEHGDAISKECSG